MAEATKFRFSVQQVEVHLTLDRDLTVQETHELRSICEDYIAAAAVGMRKHLERGWSDMKPIVEVRY
jgi:hypothetical protein